MLCCDECNIQSKSIGELPKMLLHTWRLVTSDRYSTQMTPFCIAMQTGAEKSFFCCYAGFFWGIMIDDLSLDLGMKKAWHLFIYAFCAIGGHFLWCYSPSWWAQSMNLFINHHFQDQFFCRRHLEHFRQLVNWSSLIRQNDQLRSWSILPLSLFIIFVSSPQIVFSFT